MYSCWSRPRSPESALAADLKGYVQDRAGRGLPELEKATWAVAGTAGQTPGFAQAFTLFNTRTPQIYADIDRTKAEKLGVPISRVFTPCRSTWGPRSSTTSTFSGGPIASRRRPTTPFALRLRDVANLKTRNVTGEMVPIGAVATFTDTTGPLSGSALQSLPGGRGAAVAGARILVRAGHRGD